ncbi:MAG TPA: GNAT family N-acetyltransferase [Anaerolineae bacterium]
MSEDTDTGVAVRPYVAGDRDAVLRIAADTALFGDPVEGFMEDRRLFCDIVYRYYVDLEPNSAWVAAAGGNVVGFLVGCVDTTKHDRIFWRHIVPRVALRLVGGVYRLGPRTFRYLAGLIAAGLRGEIPPVDLSSYPAHLHINLDAASRGRGAGGGLMNSYLSQLRHQGVEGVHLRTTSRNRAALHLYAKLGFQVLATRPTRLWASVVGGVVENLCFGLRLGEG